MEGSSAVVKPGTSAVVAALLLLVAISVLVAAYDFPGGSGVFPRFAGWIFVVLSGLELISHVRALLSTRGSVRTEGPLLSENTLKEIKGFLWIIFFLVALYLTGFLAGIPLYIFAFLRLSAGKSYKQCATMALAATVFIYVLFILLLEYRLYSGVLFGA
jgi:hypothetical protein